MLVTALSLLPTNSKIDDVRLIIRSGLPNISYLFSDFLKMALSSLLSPSTIFVSLLVAYSSYSIWSMAQLFIPPVCKANQKCLKPILKDNPDYQVCISFGF